jgi:hypothetical protein
MFSFEMLCKQLVSRVSSGDQTLENNKTLALRARVSYRFLVFGSPDETLNSLFTYNINIMNKDLLFCNFEVCGLPDYHILTHYGLELILSQPALSSCPVGWPGKNPRLLIERWPILTHSECQTHDLSRMKPLYCIYLVCITCQISVG